MKTFSAGTFLILLLCYLLLRNIYVYTSNLFRTLRYALNKDSYKRFYHLPTIHCGLLARNRRMRTCFSTLPGGGYNTHTNTRQRRKGKRKWEFCVCVRLCLREMIVYLITNSASAIPKRLQSTRNRTVSAACCDRREEDLNQIPRHHRYTFLLSFVSLKYCCWMTLLSRNDGYIMGVTSTP